MKTIQKTIVAIVILWMAIQIFRASVFAAEQAQSTGHMVAIVGVFVFAFFALAVASILNSQSK